MHLILHHEDELAPDTFSLTNNGILQPINLWDRARSWLVAIDKRCNDAVWFSSEGDLESARPADGKFTCLDYSVRHTSMSDYAFAASDLQAKRMSLSR